VTHPAFHHVEAVELSLEIDRRRVFPYFGTESGYLLRLFALYCLAVNIATVAGET
jgi:hypothetical protein